jgi:hypothetical protein
MLRAAAFLLGIAAVGGAPAQEGAAATAPLIPLPAGWRLATEFMDGFPPAGLQLLLWQTAAGANPPARVFCLVWDPGAPTVVFRPVLAATPRTSTQLAAAEAGAVYAAVNAGFFGGNQSFSLESRPQPLGARRGRGIHRVRSAKSESLRRIPGCAQQ